MIDEGSIGTRLQDRQIPILYLIKLEFADGDVYFTNWSQSIEWDGQVWQAMNITPTVSTMSESSNLESQALNISLSPVSSSMLSLALEDPSNYRGLPASVYMCVLDDNFRPLGDPMLRWYGYMDTMTIATDVGDDGVTGAVNLKCETGMHALGRLKTYRMNNAQQQVRVPGDKGFEYVERLITEPTTWLSVQFQRQE